MRNRLQRNALREQRKKRKFHQWNLNHALTHLTVDVSFETRGENQNKVSEGEDRKRKKQMLKSFKTTSHMQHKK